MDETQNRPTTVIVGGGQAGIEAAFALRQNGYEGRVLVFGDEEELPYRRPPLSKAYLDGSMARESLTIRKPAMLEKANIECKTGLRVTAIDRQVRKVTLSDEATIGYDDLILATGARVRRLGEPADAAANVHYIRTLADIDRLKPSFEAGKRLLVVGGGFIGLEAAASATKAGLDVTVVEMGDRLLQRVVDAPMSAYFEQAHLRRGVQVLTGTGIDEWQGGGQVQSVTLTNGKCLQVDVVVVGIGVIPETELADAAGLTVDNGIVADAYSRTNDPHIYAVGDCANHANRFLGHAARLESVPAAQEQARTAARSICGQDEPHEAVPWFWSDQFDLKLQMAGLLGAHDQTVLRGTRDEDSFVVFYLQAGIIAAAHAVNRPREFAQIRKLIAARTPVDGDKLADEACAIADAAQAAAA